MSLPWSTTSHQSDALRWQGSHQDSRALPALPSSEPMAHSQGVLAAIPASQLCSGCTIAKPTSQENSQEDVPIFCPLTLYRPTQLHPSNWPTSQAPPLSSLLLALALEPPLLCPELRCRLTLLP